jgi:Ca2+-binding RTX toxin-like protein
LVNLIYHDDENEPVNNVLDGGAGGDLLLGMRGDDVYFVDNALDNPVESEGEGYDVIHATADYAIYSPDSSIEILQLLAGTYATGNTKSQTIYGNAGDNVLDGGGGGDTLSGLGGNDTFQFVAGQAHGDSIYEFNGNGAGAGDLLKFVGYGPGATFTQQSADTWLIASSDLSIQEVIVLVGAPSVDQSDQLFV